MTSLFLVALYIPSCGGHLLKFDCSCSRRPQSRDLPRWAPRFAAAAAAFVQALPHRPRFLSPSRGLSHTTTFLPFVLLCPAQHQGTPVSRNCPDARVASLKSICQMSCPTSSSASHGLVSPIWRDRTSLPRGVGENPSTFGVKTISQPESGRART